MWEELSPQQRRSVTLQLDYQHDPATEQDRQFWWDHFQRQDDLRAQIAQWEAAAAPTAGELALRETRLKEIRQELARTEMQGRQTRNDYYPARKPVDGESGTSPASQRSAVQYVAYPKAMAQLRERLDATPEELAAWIWSGPKDGGIAAYVNANELDPPPRFHFGLGNGNGDDHDYVSPLMACWFREDEIAGFNPADRYVTGEALINRWAERPGLRADPWVRAKIGESRLSDLHPLYGFTQGTEPEDASLPQMAIRLFRLSDVEAIEAEDFGGLADPGLAAKPAEAAAGPATEPPTSTGLTEFLALEGLAPEEIRMVFVGDTAESGLAGNNMLEVSARGVTKRIPLAALGLTDRRSGSLNRQGAILVGMASGMKLGASNQNSAKVARLRKILFTHFGVQEPFFPYNATDGWLPRFQILDKRGASAERAKRDAESKTVSLDYLLDRGVRVDSNLIPEDTFEAEGDAADRWLRDNDPKAKP